MLATNNSTVSYNYGGGGAIFLNYSSTDYVTIKNSIVWEIRKVQGTQVMSKIANGGSGSLTIKYSNIQGGEESVGGDATLNWENGNIDADPMYLCDSTDYSLYVGTSLCR